jgi:hypothetical protein
MTLPRLALTSGGGSTLASRSQRFVAAGSAASRHVRALASVVTSAAAELVGLPRTQEVARAVQSSLAVRDLSCPVCPVLSLLSCLSCLSCMSCLSSTCSFLLCSALFLCALFLCALLCTVP